MSSPNDRDLTLEQREAIKARWRAVGVENATCTCGPDFVAVTAAHHVDCPSLQPLQGRETEPGREAPAMARHRIYLASSWRNAQQPAVVTALREAGHEVYDFRNPPGRTGFGWRQLDPDWTSWDARTFRTMLDHPVAVAGYDSDFDAMVWSTAFVLLLPCGRSAHLEMGWGVAAGRRTAILLADGEEPELMYRMVERLCVDVPELLGFLETSPSRRTA